MSLFGKLIPAWAIALAAALAGAALAAGVQQLRLYSAEAEHAQHREQQALVLANAEREARAAMAGLEATRKTLADKVAEIDTRISMERLDAVHQTETRLRGIAAGTIRVRYVAAACPASGSDVPDHTGPAGMAHGAGIELSAAAGQDVLVLRQSLTDDAAQIRGLKAYARVCQERNSP